MRRFSFAQKTTGVCINSIPWRVEAIMNRHMAAPRGAKRRDQRKSKTVQVSESITTPAAGPIMKTYEESKTRKVRRQGRGVVQ
jgi:hypothetical protein